MNSRRWAGISLCLAAVPLLSGCEEERRNETLRPSYERPKATAAPTDRACKGRLLRGELSYGEQKALTITGEGGLHLADVSVLGGPFEPPLALPVPAGTYPVRLVIDKAGLAHCASLEVQTSASDEPTVAGEIAIDSGTLVFADAGRLTPYLQRQPGDVFVGFEGPAGEMEALAKAVAPQLPTERVLPTYYRGTKPFSAADLDLVRSTIQSQKSHARAQVEPRPAAWPLVAAIGDGKLAASSHAGEGSAVLVDVPAGDGGYAVTVTKDPAGKIVAVVASLER